MTFSRSRGGAKDARGTRRNDDLHGTRRERSINAIDEDVWSWSAGLQGLITISHVGKREEIDPRQRCANLTLYGSLQRPWPRCRSGFIRPNTDQRRAGVADAGPPLIRVWAMFRDLIRIKDRWHTQVDTLFREIPLGGGCSGTICRLSSLHCGNLQTTPYFARVCEQ